MTHLSQLKDTSRPPKRSKRLGRGPGSKKGKTCGRGIKGAGSRSGWKSRAGKEGGQFPLYAKLPIRGFTRGAFKKRFFSLNLWKIEKFFHDGDMVNEATLREKGVVKGRYDGIKILAGGKLMKKVSVQVDAISRSARETLEGMGVVVALKD